MKRRVLFITTMMLVLTSCVFVHDTVKESKQAATNYSDISKLIEDIQVSMNDVDRIYTEAVTADPDSAAILDGPYQQIHDSYKVVNDKKNEMKAVLYTLQDISKNKNRISSDDEAWDSWSADIRQYKQTASTLKKSVNNLGKDIESYYESVNGLGLKMYMVSDLTIMADDLLKSIDAAMIGYTAMIESIMTTSNAYKEDPAYTGRLESLEGLLQDAVEQIVNIKQGRAEIDSLHKTFKDYIDGKEQVLAGNNSEVFNILDSIEEINKKIQTSGKQLEETGNKIKNL
jgi:chromosome segregation ATPase